jgi:DNA-binding XRE family transcriptional regulator
MDKKRFAKIRAYLEKTQKQMAQLMGTSAKAIESFEQGWRNISPHIERQIYFMLSQKTIMEGKSSVNCWELLIRYFCQIKLKLDYLYFL